ncbi:MAG: outer membrane protein transport protein [Bacteroidia bacterium]|nr:outer membrane protein transport protein [Bacteroidia bacterium]
MKRIYLVLALLCLSIMAFAQNEQDALRYSQNRVFGTARVQGTGGAFGALGADASAIAINPAGIALYRKTEVSVSIGVSSYFNDARYIGTNSIETKTGFNIPQFGLVFNKLQQGIRGDETKGLVSFSFGFGMNRLNDFNQSVNFTGINTQSSIADYFAELANGQTFPNTNTYPSYINNIPGMAWNTYLIDSIGVRKYGSTFRSNNDTNFAIRQSNISKVLGRINEYNISSGLNISNAIYLGASLIFQNVNYESNSTFSESVISKSSANNLYNSSEFKSTLTTSGTGIGGRFGVIVKPTNFLRFGLSYTTAVRLNLKDDYGYVINSVVNGTAHNFSQYAVSNYFEYDIVTPSKLTVSGALVHPKLGFISIDWDRVDYTNARLSAGNNLFTNENDAIKTNYRAANNVRIGAELKYLNTRFRGGYSYFESPFNLTSSGVSLDNPTQSISGGLGFLFPAIDNFGTDFFIDGALTYSWNKNYQTSYQLVEKGKTTYSAENNFSMLNVVVTAGFRF